jgi:hypothetical protein
MFYYNGAAYKDIAYLDKESRIKDEETFNQVYQADESRINAEIDKITSVLNNYNGLISNYESTVYYAK